MILVKTTKDGVVSEICNTDDYWSIVKILECLTEELEAQGIFLIKTKGYGRSRVDEFASIKNGWECGFMLAHGWVKKGSLRQDND